MFSYRVTSILLAALYVTTKAQIVYNNTQIKVNSTNQYSGTSLIGYHVGAGQSYIVARSGNGSSFSFNLSATSNQLLDNDIAAGYQLPCFIENVAAISSNSGPLECGVGGADGAFRISNTTPPSNAAPGKISFAGISRWYICAVQSFTYGWVQGTIVGSFGDGLPSGDGVQNCTSIDSIAFAIAVSSTSSTTAGTTTGGSASASTSMPTASVTESASASTFSSVMPTSITPSQDSASYVATMRTVIVPCQSAVPAEEASSSAPTSSNASTSVTARISNPIATYTGSSFTPIAPWTGAASTTEVSALIGLVFAVAALLS